MSIVDLYLTSTSTSSLCVCYACLEKMGCAPHNTQKITVSVTETLFVGKFIANLKLTLFNAKYKKNHTDNNLKFIHFD